MRRRGTTRITRTTDDDDSIIPADDDLREKLALIEREVNRRFEEIDQDLQCLKINSEQIRKDEHDSDERFLKLCHAVDYLLEHTGRDYDTLACREMILSLLGQKSARPFNGRTIRNRELRGQMKKWCLFVALILFCVACMSIYGLHRRWCYLMVILFLSGSLLSSIGLRRIYRIIEKVW